MRRTAPRAALARTALAAALAGAACSNSGRGESGPVDCDQACLDRTALRSLRDTLKLVYNLALQGNPSGAQDEATPCPDGGGARVFGEASGSAEQGATQVSLTYQLGECGYLRRDDDAEQSYRLAITGELLQTGVIAVQPSTTTALVMSGEGLRLDGTVYDPAQPFLEEDCAVELGQDGDLLSGTFCGRVIGLELE